MASPNPNQSALKQMQELQTQFDNQTAQNTYWIRPFVTPHVGVCPACGHCPHCGRGGYVSPYNPWPFQPYSGGRIDGSPFNNC
jgi:hypothetical protein